MQKTQSGHKAPEMCGRAFYCDAPESYFGRKRENAEAALKQQVVALVFVRAPPPRVGKTSDRGTFRTLCFC